jgi:hypothetical protein
MESLIAMMVVSLVMGILALSLSSSSGAMKKAGDRALFGIQLLRADSLIRDRIGAVAIPWWEQAAPEFAESSVTIPWYQGEREGFVRLLAEEGALVLETGGKEREERILLMSGLDGLEFSVLRNEGSVPYGIGVAYIRGQHSYHTLSAFSTIPLAGPSLERGRP